MIDTLGLSPLTWWPPFACLPCWIHCFLNSGSFLIFSLLVVYILKWFPKVLQSVIFWIPFKFEKGFPDSSVGKESACNAGDPSLFWVRKICWRRDRLPTPEFWPGRFHGLYSPWGWKESDMTEWLSLKFENIFTLLSQLIDGLARYRGCPGGWDWKESAWNAGDLGSIPGLGRSPGRENGYLL